MDDTQRWLDYLAEVETELGGQGRRAGVRPRQAVFLAEYSNTFNVSAAASRADVTRQQIYRWKSEDPTFHRAWEEAQETIKDTVLGEIFHRAVHGVEVAIRDRHGKIVGTERRASDRLLVATAKALDDRFRGSPRLAAAPPDPSWRKPLIAALSDPESRQLLDALADRLTPPRP